MAGASLFDTSQKSSLWIEVAIKCFRQVVLGDGRKAASKPPSTLARLRFRLPVCPCCICSSSYFEHGGGVHVDVDGLCDGCKVRTSPGSSSHHRVCCRHELDRKWRQHVGSNRSGRPSSRSRQDHANLRRGRYQTGGATAGPQCFQQAASFIKFPMQYSQFGTPSPAQIANLMEQHDVSDKGSES
ncbi:hypothetical protein pipiens_018321 [Culex pipiens pipiens]|uniref:Uncharacterized protein n=1 Tax=Culex pipiens pipiens TaxID=38569 RepID=A0ABD1CCC8_CULPP